MYINQTIDLIITLFAIGLIFSAMVSISYQITKLRKKNKLNAVNSKNIKKDKYIKEVSEYDKKNMKKNEYFYYKGY